MSSLLKTTLYYDGVCSLCSREMRMLRSVCDDGLYLKDIHSLSVKEADGLPPKLELLLYLHARTEKGSWFIGPDAMARAWLHTPYGKLFSILRLPGLSLIVDYCYKHWAKRRYERNLAHGLYQTCNIDKGFDDVASDEGTRKNCND